MSSIEIITLALTCSTTDPPLDLWSLLLMFARFFTDTHRLSLVRQLLPSCVCQGLRDEADRSVSGREARPSCMCRNQMRLP